MEAILALKRARKARLLSCGFFDWVRSTNLPIAERLRFAPIMANFVMGFRDANKWFIRFPQPQSRLEEIINRTTLEDETHSRLFLEQWQLLGLDQHLGFRASDTLYWLYFAKETERYRRIGFELARLNVEDGGDPLVRFAHTEAGEACGNAFFSVLAPIADEVSRQAGAENRYFGSYHLALEVGHLVDCPDIYERISLSESQRQLGIALASRTFDLFDEIHDGFLEYAKNYVETHRVPKRPPVLRNALSTVAAQEPAGSRAVRGLSASQASIEEVLEERKEQASRHPLYAWLDEERSVAPKQKLMRLIPYWIVDILGYRELNAYAIRYPSASSASEELINSICSDLETHNSLFLSDWDALGMDEALSWRASETLRFCYLDPRVDVHRKNLATFAKLAMRHKSPVLRFWLIEALEASGHAFFAHTKKLALVVEQNEEIRLDYLADRHFLAHSPERRSASDRGLLLSQPITGDDVEVAIGMVNAVFDALEEQLSLSLEAVQKNLVLGQGLASS